MTPEQYFKQFPFAKLVIQVGKDLFHEGYEASARDHSQRVGEPVVIIHRETDDQKATAKTK